MAAWRSRRSHGVPFDAEALKSSMRVCLSWSEDNSVLGVLNTGGILKTASQVQIRRATVDDASRVASVLRKAFAEYEPLYTKQGYAATVLGRAAILVRIQQGPVWIALHREQIAGTVSAAHKEAALYVCGVAVVPEARGLGIAQLLLEQVEAFAVEEGFEQLILSTTPFLLRAIRLYEKLGFRAIDDGPQDLFGTPLCSMQKMLAPRVSQ